MGLEAQAEGYSRAVVRGNAWEHEGLGVFCLVFVGRGCGLYMLRDMSSQLW